VPTSDLQASIIDAEVVFVSVPSKAVQNVIRSCVQWLQPEQILISTTKGIQADGFRFMSQVLKDETSSDFIGVLSGPNLAKELVAKMLTGTVVASDSEYVRETVQSLLSCEYFRVYGNSDMFGVELGASLKNIYAIAAGMATAMGMGENTKSMLITRSLAEMSRFAAAFGGNPYTFLGLAGVGDLFVTCSSKLSRNFQVGYALAEGNSLEQVLENLGGTAEGVNTVKLVKQKSDELGIYMPLVQGLYEILFEGGAVYDVVKKLMLGAHNSDVEFVLPGPHTR